MSISLLALFALVFSSLPVGATPGDLEQQQSDISMQQDRLLAQGVFDSPVFSADSVVPSAVGSMELNHLLESNSDVVVFPIWVAGPVSAASDRRYSARGEQAGGGGNIAVIYPDIGEPYRSVFMQILDGIEEKARGRTTNVAVGANFDVAELNSSLRRQETKVVIALGRQGVKVATALDSDIGIVVGGVLMTPESETHNLRVNSLSPDPALLFTRLRGMMPKVRRVFTVYDPRQNEWLIQLAKAGAEVQGLELVAYPAQDLRSAMRAYQEIISVSDTRQDALWLPQDSITVEESAVLPMVLQESWSNNMTVFSSSFAHVKRGVLFSLYPDNVELGRHLANSALDMLNTGGNDVRGLTPLREVLMAVNLRTAKHLGLNTGRLQGFDMAFPEQ